MPGLPACAIAVHHALHATSTTAAHRDHQCIALHNCSRVMRSMSRNKTSPAVLGGTWHGMDGEADDVPLNSLAAVVDPATDVVTESDVAVTIAPPTTNRAVSFKAELVTPVGVPMSTGLPPRFEFSDKFERHERKFVLFTCGVCLVLMAGCVIASAAAPTTFGEFYPAIATNFAIIFLAEVVWRALLSCVAYRYASRFKRTINYTRKLGNCFKLYKLFVFGEPKPKPKPEPSPHPPAL